MSVNKFLNKLINMGIDDALDLDLKRKLRLCNRIIFTTNFFIIPFVFVFWAAGFPLEGISLIPIGLTFLIAILLNKKGNYISGRLLVILLVNFYLGSYAYYFGRDSGIHWVAIVFSGMPFLVFSLKEYIWIAVGILSSFSVFYFTEYHRSYGFVDMAPDSIQLISYAMIGLTLLWTVINYYYLSSTNNECSNIFKIMLESTPDPTIVIGPDGAIRFVNRQLEKVFGYSRDEVIGERVEILLPNSHKKKHPKLRAQYFSNPHTREMGSGIELYGRRKSGETFPVEVSLSPMIIDEETIVSATIRDVTQRRENEKLALITKETEARNKELEQFAYVASHDLREPLNTVISMTKILEMEHHTDLGEEGLRALNFINHATHRMDRLICELLDYSRLGSNRMRETVHCDKIMSDILIDLSALIEKTTTNISVKELPELKGYPQEIAMLFQNLITNAIKYNDKPPKIEINAKKANKFWEFAFTDNGIGIDPEHRMKVFDIFQRLHRQHEFEGTGIGLAHCKKIVEIHGGQIWIETNPKGGSIFKFTIDG